MVIISHKHKFIYIKSYKTASTSIQIFLGQYCGKDDVLTPIQPVTSEQGRLYNEQARNYHGFYTHMSAKEIRNKVGRNIWNKYFKFTFERNPWDKAVSFYYFECKTKNLEHSFEEWIREWIKRKRATSNYGLYTINNKIAVDFIGTYENLVVDLKFILNKLNLPYGELPQEKSGYRKVNEDYKSLYNEETKKLVEQRNKKEIEHFNYKF
jgi:hypothetical protein